MKEILLRDPYLAILFVILGGFSKTQDFTHQLIWVITGVIILLIRNRSKIKWAEKETPSSQKGTTKQ